jgi:hypothetical protein
MAFPAEEAPLMSQAAEIERRHPTPARFTAKEAARLASRAAAVDAVGLEERAASLAKRSIKRDSKLWALDLAIRSMDLTTLEGSDTVGKIVAMCAKAVRPNPVDSSVPSVAASGRSMLGSGRCVRSWSSAPTRSTSS